MSSTLCIIYFRTASSAPNMSTTQKALQDDTHLAEEQLLREKQTLNKGKSVMH
jgi:hypothetical protein